MSQNYDLVLIGGGPGGYVAAIRAAQLGLNVAVIEKDRLGGTCLQRGCIPSKSLLRSAEIYRNSKDGEEFGVVINNLTLDFSKVQARKRKVVDQLTKGIESLFKQNKVTLIEGYGRIVQGEDSSLKAVEVEKPDGSKEVIHAKKLIIATGSRPKSLPNLHIDGKFVMTSDEALEMEIYLNQ